MGKKAVALAGGAGIPTQAGEIIEAETIYSANQKSVGTGLVATGSSITDALALTKIVNVVATTAGSTGVKLPNVDIGVEIIVQNNGANALNLYPPSSAGTLNGGSAGSPVTIAAAAGNVATRLSATDWLVSVFAKES